LSHKFNVGQTVDLTPGMPRGAPAGPYEVCRLMPASDSDTENPRYRIKSVTEKHERMASESDLTLSLTPESVFC